MTPQLLPCPACQCLTALWVEVRPTEKLRCPHCGGEFLYSQLASEPPASWQLVEDDSESPPLAGRQTNDATAGSAGSRTVNMIDPSAQTLFDLVGDYEGVTLESPTQAQNHDSESRATNHGVAEESQSIDSSDSSADPVAEAAQTATEASPPAASTSKIDWSSYQALNPHLYNRQRRKSASPLWSVVQVALGGLAAIPIALLLVWHVVGTDVADAGAWVGQYVPWIVPEELRPDQPLTNEWAEPQAPRSSGLPPLASTPPATSPPATSPSGDAIPAAVLPATVEHNAPLLENTFALIRQATANLDDWSLAARRKDVDLRTLAPATYGDLTNLALVLDRLPPENLVMRTVRSQLKPLGHLVVDDAEVRRLISEGARYWVATQAASSGSPEVPADTSQASASQGGSYGLAMIVGVEAVEEVVNAEGTWWSVVATSASRLGEPSLEIRIPAEVALSLGEGQLAPQQSLFLLGGVRQVAESSPPQSNSAPTRPRFMASYAIGLSQ